MTQKILVTGGAGYVGSHICKALLEYGYEPVILDDLSTGFLENVPAGVRLIQTDIRDFAALLSVFHVEQFQAVIHCAAKTSVPEGEEKPDLYTQVNVQGTLNVCLAASRSGVQAVILSSTAAVYGDCNDTLTEQSQTAPKNWYGKTKLRAEEMVQALKPHTPYAILRYFNVCGASESHGDRRPPTMLLPRLIECALKKETFVINGTDYPTQDGTAVRDIIHVEDLARAHVYAIRELLGGYMKSEVINLGSAQAYSVKTLASNVASLYGMPIKTGPRRSGDVPVAHANIIHARNTLSWAPTKTLLQIIQSEYEWRRKFV